MALGVPGAPGPATLPHLRIGLKEAYGSSTSQLTIPLAALRRHLCVLGGTGSGKSVIGVTRRPAYAPY